jgi:hypothetical protein
MRTIGVMLFKDGATDRHTIIARGIGEKEGVPGTPSPFDRYYF